MKLSVTLLALLFGVLMLANIANAETPREQLRQMVEQLQKSPNDNALRERVIKLAQEVMPAPAVPEEAERRMQRGAAALEGAKSVADYQSAAKEFEQATLAAPWYGAMPISISARCRTKRRTMRRRYAASSSRSWPRLMTRISRR